MITVNKHKLTKLVTKVIDIQESKIKKRQPTGLTKDDILMWDRIFSQPEPEPTYQYHFALDPKWQAKNKRTTKLK